MTDTISSPEAVDIPIPAPLQERAKRRRVLDHGWPPGLPFAPLLRRAYYTAWRGADARGEPFDLSADDLFILVDRSNGRCEKTGIRFTDQEFGAHKRPFIPTIDRINAGEPYSFKNCRIICWVANLALNDWGDEVFELLIALAAKERGWTPPRGASYFSNVPKTERCREVVEAQGYLLGKI